MAQTDEKNDEAASEPKAGRSKLVLVLVITNVLVLGGAGAAVFFALTQPAQQASAEPAAAEQPTQLGPLVEMTAFVVNLSDENSSRYLRAEFRLEVADADRQADVEAHIVPARSAVLLYLSSLTVEETTGEENRRAIVERVRELVNEQMGGALVRNVYVTDFVVQ